MRISAIAALILSSLLLVACGNNNETAQVEAPAVQNVVADEVAATEAEAVTEEVAAEEAVAEEVAAEENTEEAAGIAAAE